MRRILLWLQGYLIICVTGKEPRRFLTLLAGRGMLLSGTVPTATDLPEHGEFDGFLARVRLSDYKRIGVYARKCGVLPLIYRKIGLPFWIQRIRRYQTRSLGILLFIVMLYVLQKFLWSVQIQGNFVHSEEQLLTFLREQGIAAGIRMDSISCEELETMIRTQYPDIIWVSCEKSGTRLNIHVKEAYRYASAEAPEMESGDLVATVSGVVRKILVRTGTPMVKVGDTVQAGDVLISGTRIVTDAYNVELSRSYVLADGDVEIELEIEDELTFPMTEQVREYDTDGKNHYTLTAFGHNLIKYQSSIPPKDCDIITTYADLRLFEQLYLPIEWSKSTYQSYRMVEKRHTEESIRERTGTAYLSYLEQRIQEGYEILEEHSELLLSEETAALQIRLRVSCRGCRLAEIPKEDTADDRNDDKHPD